jgi:hypothetical protein
MSDICIIGASNIKHISMISLYTKYFDEHHIDYDIIFLDRYGIEEKTTAKNQYCLHSRDVKGKTEKIREFLRFRKFVLSIVTKNRYKLIVTWQATTAYLLCDILGSRFKRRFIINIRDYIMEKNRIIYALLAMQIRQSAFTTISSEGFREFLPKGEYLLVNSINEELLTNITPDGPAPVKEFYKVGFVGNCRYFRESYRLIGALANDRRFEVWYCGTNSEVLARYAAQNVIHNVKTMPGFEPKNTLKIIAGFDIVNSAFGNDALDNRTLKPIRLYTAIAMHKPVLVNVDTQLAKEIEKGKIGYVINSYANLADQLAKYLRNIDNTDFAARCDAYLKAARNENRHFYKKLGQLVDEIG